MTIKGIKMTREFNYIHQNKSVTRKMLFSSQVLWVGFIGHTCALKKSLHGYMMVCNQVPRMTNNYWVVQGKPNFYWRDFDLKCNIMYSSKVLTA